MNPPTEEVRAAEAQPLASGPDAGVEPAEEELRRACAEEAWSSERRYDRALSSLGMIGLGIGWASDYAAVGFTSLGFWLLLVRVLAVLTNLPLFLATFSTRRPRWLDLAKLVLIGGTPTFVIAIATLNPVHIRLQGWGMVLAWSLVGMGIHAPLRPKLLVGYATFVIYVAHLLHLMSALGARYASANEILAVLATGAACIGLTPMLPARMEERRFREFVMRRRLEREIRLRERREAEAREQKVRADEAAEEARTAARRAEREGKLRTQMLANLSHDLRTPMAGILGLVELMHHTPLSEEQAGYIETIRASNQTLLALLDDIVDFSRIEEGKLPLAPVPVSLADVLLAPVSLLRGVAERKGIELTAEIDRSLPPFVMLDAARIQQILLNLLGNAIKFTPKGRVTLRASQHSSQPGGRMLHVDVIDTGVGFSRQQRERLFKRFGQGDDSTAGRFGGSGLGLSICKGLVSLMGGTIDAESQTDRGSRFWFELPMEECDRPSSPTGSGTLPKMLVLLAEDNPVNQMVLSAMLKKLGQTVSVASDGQQALRMLTEQPFDLAIMDMQMPMLDGDEVARRLQLAGGVAAGTHVVALTAAATAEQMDRYRRAGIDAIYTKPIDMDRLTRMLVKEGGRAIAKRAPRPALSDAPTRSA